jgi:hypothetical protein
VERFTFEVLRGNIRDCEVPTCEDPDWLTIAQTRARRLAKFNQMSLKALFYRWLDLVERQKKTSSTSTAKTVADDETDASEAETAENTEWWTVECEEDDASEDDSDDASEDDSDDASEEDSDDASEEDDEEEDDDSDLMK